MAQRVEILGAAEVSKMLAEVDRDITLAGKPGKQAAILIARTAASYGPNDSGVLAGSFRGFGGKRQGRVVSRAKHAKGRSDKANAGYANVIEYGWPARNIEPQYRAQRAITANAATVRALFEEHVRSVLQAKGVLK